MKAFVTLIIILMGVSLTMPACAGNSGKRNKPAEKGRVLVAYFSCTNTTKGIAESIAQITGADLFCITPETEYTYADLNYNNPSCRANLEQNDPAARPAINRRCENLADYEVVFLGYPIWWGAAPKVIYTFLENHDLAGKTIIPFCTSGSSGVGTSASDLRSCAPDAVWRNGRRFPSNVSPATLTDWIDENMAASGIAAVMSGHGHSRPEYFDLNGANVAEDAKGLMIEIRNGRAVKTIR